MLDEVVIIEVVVVMGEGLTFERGSVVIRVELTNCVFEVGKELETL